MHAIEFDSAVEALLLSAQLPTDDLHGTDKVALFGHTVGGKLVGVVGFEIYGSDALLRSLAVAQSERGRGLGNQLLRFAEQQAAACGARSIYLLTTSAEDFFSRLGYVRADRGCAPAAIATTAQFSTLCPSSSAFMVKRATGILDKRLSGARLSRQNAPSAG